MGNNTSAQREFKRSAYRPGRTVIEEYPHGELHRIKMSERETKRLMKKMLFEQKKHGKGHALLSADATELDTGSCSSDDDDGLSLSSTEKNSPQKAVEPRTRFREAVRKVISYGKAEDAALTLMNRTTDSEKDADLTSQASDIFSQTENGFRGAHVAAPLSMEHHGYYFHPKLSTLREAMSTRPDGNDHDTASSDSGKMPAALLYARSYRKADGTVYVVQRHMDAGAPSSHTSTSSKESQDAQIAPLYNELDSLLATHHSSRIRSEASRVCSGIVKRIIWRRVCHALRFEDAGRKESSRSVPETKTTATVDSSEPSQTIDGESGPDVEFTRALVTDDIPQGSQDMLSATEPDIVDAADNAMSDGSPEVSMTTESKPGDGDDGGDNSNPIFDVGSIPADGWSLVAYVARIKDALHDASNSTDIGSDETVVPDDVLHGVHRRWKVVIRQWEEQFMADHDGNSPTQNDKKEIRQWYLAYHDVKNALKSRQEPHAHAHRSSEPLWTELSYSVEEMSTADLEERKRVCRAAIRAWCVGFEEEHGHPPSHSDKRAISKEVREYKAIVGELEHRGSNDADASGASSPKRRVEHAENAP